MPEYTVVNYTTQYCLLGYDITTQFHAETDADVVRFWEDDFCLVELTRTGHGTWKATGGDSTGWPELAHVHEPIDALLALLPPEEYTLVDVS